MKTPFRCLVFAAFSAFLLLLLLPVRIAQASPTALPDFPKKNVWSRITPSVAWCGDSNSSVTIEVHIVGRSDVRKVWVANLAAGAGDPPLEKFDDGSRGLLFYDDGTHGDAAAGDSVFTHDGLILPCNPAQLPGSRGWNTFWGFVRVELADGTRLGESFGMAAGLVDPKYKDVFAVRDWGNNLSATAYAFFIQDDKHEVMDSYPVANVYCGTSNYMAYRKLYSVLPDAFDIDVVMPGMQIVRPKDLYENVPYDILVSNTVEHIGLSPYHNTAAFGSAGRLKSIVYHSFGDPSVATHEMGHTWGMHFGAALGLIEDPSNPQSHWSALTDIGGVMGAYYNDGAGNYGHFHYNGDETWSWISNAAWEPFSPLELYVMGMIPPEEVPPVHILTSPNLTDLKRITTASYKTITIDQLQNLEGGPRNPSAADSQKGFNVAFIVTQDAAFNDAAYAFFSLISHYLMRRDPPDNQTYFASFYWATGGRGSLNTRLPVDVADPAVLPGLTAPASTATLESTDTVSADVRSKQTQKAQSAQTAQAAETPIPAAATAAVAATTSAATAKPPSGSPICNCPILVGGLTILPGAWWAWRRKHKRN
jgi:hypothetical protein